jgi:sugar lactone lactonase YvrE
VTPSRKWSIPQARALAVAADGSLFVGTDSDVLLKIPVNQLQTDTPTPSLRLSGNFAAGIPRKLAFDGAGNLWSTRINAANAVVMYSKQQLELNGDQAATPKTITIKGFDDGGMGGLAFDAAGNLWLGAARPNAAPPHGALLSIAASDLQTPGEKTPARTIGGFNGSSGLTFDENGDVWLLVRSDNTLLRFSKAQLQQSGNIKPAQAFLVGTEFATSAMVLNPSIKP